MADILKYGNAIRLAQLASDPSSPENGVLYYNTTDGVIKQYIGGSWEQIPDQALTLLGLALNDGEIIVGNASNVSAAVDTDSVGDIQADHSAGLTIKSGVIVNGQISASAAISLSKLAALTASRALVSDGSGVISASSVTSTELGYVSGVTSAIQTQLNNKAADADVIKKDGSVAFTADQSMGGFKLTNVAAPVSGSDAANKTYVDSVAEGLRPKEAVRVASTANVVIASELENGDTLDGITLATGDRVLLKNQSTASQNGIYVVVASGAASRSTDFDSLTPIDEINGAMVPVQEGTENAGKIFVQTGTVTTLGTDPINFVYFNSVSTLVGGDGITISGTNVSVDHDGQGLQFTANQLALELDGSTLSKSASGVKVADGGISNTQINASAAIDATKIADGSVTNTEFQYIGGLTSDAQTQLNGKANTALSNLASTAVNADIIPDTNNARDLGSAALQFNRVRTGALRSYDYASASSTGDIASGSNTITNVADTSGFQIDMVLVGPGIPFRTFITAVGASTITLDQNATATNAGATIAAQYETAIVSAPQSSNSTSSAIQLRSGNTANVKSGHVIIRTGNSTSDNSGDIFLNTGSSGATRGQVRLNGSSISLESEVNANNQLITNVQDPASPQDAATKAYVDAVTTTDVAEGTNLYFTDERAQDAVGTILVDSSSIDFTYNDGTPSITAAVLPAGVDHDALQNFVANEHVDHSTVQIATAANTSGLTGGGNITATRNLSVDINGTTAETSADNADKILIYDNSATALKSMTRANFLSGIAITSAGDINETSFTGLANNTANQVITGFAFNNATVRSFKALVSVLVDATSDSFAVYELMGIQRGADWQMSETFTGDSITGLTFDITSAGQVRVTIGNITGFSSGTIKFRAQTTSI